MSDCTDCGEQETFNVWTDWRGNPYTVGDTVLFARMSGRSCEMAEGVITDMYEVYYNPNYKAKTRWHPLKPGESAPLHTTWKWKNTETGEISQYNMSWKKQDGEPWERVEVTEPRETERRAKIMPTLRTSRFNSYEARRTKWVWDEKTKTGEFADAGPRKPITLTVTESITVPAP